MRKKNIRKEQVISTKLRKRIPAKAPKFLYKNHPNKQSIMPHHSLQTSTQFNWIQRRQISLKVDEDGVQKEVKKKYLSPLNPVHPCKCLQKLQAFFSLQTTHRRAKHTRDCNSPSFYLSKPGRKSILTILKSLKSAYKAINSVKNDNPNLTIQHYEKTVHKILCNLMFLLKHPCA